MDEIDHANQLLDKIELEEPPNIANKDWKAKLIDPIFLDGAYVEVLLCLYYPLVVCSFRRSFCSILSS